ncbi:MAG: hypothetical protein JWM47_3160 [Acidimicrobiales bacterium]|nr:hypothetical protein [Acidimicrobiales bacterium]
MLAFLSPEWLRALDEAARLDPALAAASASVDLVIEQRVADPGGAEVQYHVVLDHGRVAVIAGPAPHADVRFSQDRATALGIASGNDSAQRAFMTGRLQVGGDLRLLLEHQDVLVAVQDVFAGVRARTDLTAADEPAGSRGA